MALTEAQIKDYWEHRGAVYNVSANNIKHPLAHIASHLIDNKTKSILDIGSGWGRVYKYLKKKYRHSYQMCDIAESMIEGCYVSTGIRPKKWNGHTLPYGDRSFNACLLIHILQHITPHRVEGVLQEVCRVCTSEVYVIDNNIPTNAMHCFSHDYDLLFSQHKMKCVEKKDFDKISLWILKNENTIY